VNLNVSLLCRLMLSSLTVLLLPNSTRSQSADGDSTATTITLTVEQARAISAAVSRAFEYGDKLDSAKIVIALQDTLLRKIEGGYKDALQTKTEQLASTQRTLDKSERKVRIWKSVSSALAGAVLALTVMLL